MSTLHAPSLNARVEGIGFWTRGLPSWAAARDYALNGTQPAEAPARPSAQLLPANERRRAPETVAVALEVALAACEAASRQAASLPSVFASAHGELAITDYMCATLAADPRALSPTKFHNSVHNAAAGYWTIGTGAMQPANAISANAASFAQGLIEALTQLHSDADAVLLVAYDGQATGPLAMMAPSEGLLGGALVLSHEGPGPRLHARLVPASTRPSATGPLSQFASANASAPMLPLFDVLAHGKGSVVLPAGAAHDLLVEVNP